jgi:mono/diheme cytochrome c family protein
MPLAGMLLSRSPYHWDATLHGPAALMVDTFVSRMGGTVDSQMIYALFGWLDGLRHVRAHPAAPASAIAIGRDVFVSATCDECHAGAAFTNNTLASVGGTETVKVPSLLGVGIRDRLLHDGSQADLDARFAPVWADGTFPSDVHGDLSSVTAEEIEALKAYLRTL